MVELPELNEDQRVFLFTIFNYFHSEGKWPTFLWVENTIRKTHPEIWPDFDMVAVCKSLPDNFATGFSFNHQYEQEAVFIAPVLSYFPDAKEEIDDFIRVLGFCVERINTSDEARPAISSEDLSSQLHMQPLAIRKMGLLLQSEVDIADGSGYSENGWHINLKRGKDGVRRFEGVESFQQYLERRTALTHYFSGKVAVQPVQNEQMNDISGKHAREREAMLTVKVLFLAANPSSTDRLAIDEEMRAIEQKVRAAEHRDALVFQSNWAVRPDDLLQLLNQHRPQIVHFSGHGSHAGLSLAGNDGQVRVVTTQALTALFATLKDNIRLVFLNACYSREQAQALVTNIDCVVGMKESIRDDAATVFASSFYRAIGFGRSIQEAYDQGKTALLLEGIPEEDIPELLVKDGIDPSQVVLIGPAGNPS